MAAQAKIMTLLAEALLLVDQGGSIGYADWREFSRILYALGNLLTVSGYSENSREKRTIIWTALMTLPKDGTATKPMLDTAVETERRGVASHARWKYEVLFTSNLEESADQLFAAGLAAAGSRAKFRFVSVDDAFNVFKARKQPLGLVPPPKEYERDLARYSFCVMEEHAVSPRQAIDAAMKEFESARAWTNFALQVFIATTTFLPRQLSQASPSFFVRCYDEKGQEVDAVYTIGMYDYQSRRIDKHQLAYALGFMQHVAERRKGVLLERVRTVVGLYGAAMDTFGFEYRFFHLWQALEVALGISDEKKMAQRISGLFGDEVMDAVMGAALHKRNKFVHGKETGGFTEDDTLILQNVIDNLVIAMLDINDDFPTDADVEDFWAFWCVNDTDLKRKEAVLDKVIAMREKLRS